jgi:hypothetical protein
MRARAHTSARAAALHACAYRTRAIVRVLRLFGGAEAASRGEELGEGIVRRGSEVGRCGVGEGCVCTCAESSMLLHGSEWIDT